MTTSLDRRMMYRALVLARRALGRTAPNPLVGAVIVRDGKIVGEGWHRKAGDVHGEIAALRKAGEAARGATLYVNLEPCNHVGETPPCTDAIIKAGIAKVVYGTADPNPNVTGQGAATLRANRIEVVADVLGAQAKELNRGWLTWVTTARPFVSLKLAVSRDKKIAKRKGEQLWLTSRISAAYVHRLRREVDAILVGAGTVRADNPRLTNRSGRGTQPLRVVVDSTLTLDARSLMFKRASCSDEVARSLVATTSAADSKKRLALENAGTEVVKLASKGAGVDLTQLLEVLGARGIRSVLCEGGAELATALIKQNLVHRLYLFEAPLSLGREALAWYLDKSEESAVLTTRFDLRTRRKMGPDTLYVYDTKAES